MTYKQSRPLHGAAGLAGRLVRFFFAGFFAGRFLVGLADFVAGGSSLESSAVGAAAG